MMTAVIGGVHLAAWLGGVMAQRGVSAVTMKANTALCLLLLGVGLVLLAAVEASGAVRRWTGRACAALALLIGALSLGENLFSWNLGIDQLLATEPAGALGTLHPNLMGTPASICFTLAGLALLFLSRRRGWTVWTAQAMALGICLIALLGNIGYLYGVRGLYGVARVTTIAWPTALALLLLGVGLLFARAREGLMAQVTAGDPGGAILRRLLLPALLLPIILGWLRLAGERLGHFETAMGTALLMLTFIAALSTLAWFAGRWISRSAAEIARQKELLGVTLTSIGDGVISCDGAGWVTFLNPVAEGLTGWKNGEARGEPIQSVFKIINEQTRQGAEDIVGRVLREGHVVELANHTALVARDGREIPIEDSAAPILDDAGQVDGVVLVFHDVTQRRRAQEEMELVARFPQENPNPILRIRQDGQLIYSNQAGLVLTEAWGCPCGAKVTGQAWEIAAGVLESAASREWEIACNERIYLLNFVPLKDLGYVNVYGRDITKRKRAEEELCASETKYRNLFENMTEEVHFWEIVRDEQGGIKTWRLVDVNPPALKTWGRANRDEIKGRTTDEIFGPGATEHYLPVIQKIMTEGVPYSFEDYFPHLDKYFRFTSVPFGNHFITTGADITSLKKAHREVEQQREWLHVTLKSIGDGVITCDTEGRVTFLNPVAEALSGWRTADALGHPIQSVFNIINEQTRQPSEDIVGRVLREKCIVELANHTALVARDGREVPIEDSAAPILDGAGDVAGAVLVFHDVTEKRRAQEALAESEKRLTGVLESMPEAFVSFDHNLRYTYVNGNAERLQATQRKELIGKDVRAVYPDPEAYKSISKYEEVIAKNKALTFINFHAGFDRWVEVSAFPTPDGISVFYKDISERIKTDIALRESEARFRLALRNAPVSVAVQDRDLRYIWAYNQRTAQTKEIIGHFDHDLLTPEEAARVTAIKRRVLEEDITLREQIWLERPNDRIFLDICWEPIHDETGDVIGVGSAAVDLTPIKLAEEALHRANDQLREADRRKDEFLAMLAHELRNPLAPIRNAAQILKLAGANEPVREKNREIIDRQANHMGRLLDDLLEVSRVTRGKIALKLEPLDLRTIVMQAIEVATPAAHGRRLKIHYANPPEPVMLEGDFTRLEQVIGNLINNAIKYSDEGQIQVTVGCESERDGDGSWAVVRVRDTGIGISPEMLPRVFELFAQADQSLERQRGGLGIGLTMVKRLVDLHGGRVEARSDGLGQGSEFSVLLPLVEKEIPQAAPAVQSPAPVSQEETPLKVLVVDDNQDSAGSLKELLEMWGYDVRTAFDGQEAIQLACTFVPDVVLLDIGLPGMSGYAVARKLREERSLETVKIIAMTGYGQEEDRKMTSESGFDAHLVKPVDLHHLQIMLARIMVGA